MKKLTESNSLPQKMRKSQVNPTEQRKRFLALAIQLRQGIEMTEAQRQYLSDAFTRIGNGESADAALRLKRGRGQKQTDDDHRQKISLVFQQVATNIAPVDGQFPGGGMSLHSALLKAVPFARQLFGVETSEMYSIEYLFKLWHDPSYAHMQSPFRTPLDPDSPFPVAPELL